jgi:hypothetical protein
MNFLSRYGGICRAEKGPGRYWSPGGESSQKRHLAKQPALPDSSVSVLIVYHSFTYGFQS